MEYEQYNNESYKLSTSCFEDNKCVLKMAQEIYSILKQHGIELNVNYDDYHQTTNVSFKYKGKYIINNFNNFNFKMIED